MEYKIYWIILSVSVISSSADLETPMAPLENEMTSDLLVMLSNETKDYKPSSVADMMNATRRQFMADRFRFIHYGKDHTSEKIMSCYYTSVTYRSAMLDLRSYFDLRFIYVGTLEFEVGYLTHEIIYRYQVVLELYQMAERRFMPHQNRNFAFGSYMLYMYTNILEQCKVIIHLCNMLHEVEKKYKVYSRNRQAKKNVFDDYHDPRAQDTNISKIEERLEREQRAYELWVQKKKQLQRKQAKAEKKYHSQFAKYGKTTTRKKTTPKKSDWPLIYGWSIEEW